MSSFGAVLISCLFNYSFLFFILLFICQRDLEGQLSSHESVSGTCSSSVEDHIQDSRSMISTRDHTNPLKSTQHETNKQLPLTEADENTFMAHVIIEQALHLPTVLGDNNARYSIRSIQFVYRVKTG